MRPATRTCCLICLASLAACWPGCAPAEQTAEGPPAVVDSEREAAGARAPVTGLAVGEVAAPRILQTSGGTMGTYYAVTLANPPAELPSDWKERIDLELREVNDQMSTYLKSSELGRFNLSNSTEWFAVSPETAAVVSAGQEIAEATEGAFDVTVGPLVNAWGFGPEDREFTPPSDERIAELRRSVGYRHLHVRMDPPGLRKDLPGLKVDLSAIAKGHGVDRVLALLVSLGCEHVFVDIGGEERAQGRRGNRAWRVALEDPNEDVREYSLVYELHDQAIATSGDYRNFFEYQGRRYSHTIDPRSGRPIEHGVASVSVMHQQCMMADGWATAINVLGPEAGMRLARDRGLAVRLVVRTGDGQFAAQQTENFPDSILSTAGAAK